MEKIEQYLTIKEGWASDATFDKYISTKLQEGWTLYGNPYIDKEGNYCQAMCHTDKYKDISTH